MANNFITEISEADFRKLDITAAVEKMVEVVKGVHQLQWIPVKLNDILDREIKGTLEDGYENDLFALQIPVTVAIHKKQGYYLDKFMDRFSGPKTYEIGLGIPHIYISRDYYEARDGDYWRVKKNETEAIYRVHLDPKWQDKFVLKHKVERLYPDKNNLKHWIETHLVLDEETGEWVIAYKTECEITDSGALYTRPMKDLDEN